MDQPHLDAAEHAAALDALNRVNRLSSAVPLVWSAIQQLAAEVERPLRVMDLGCGGGDTLRRLSAIASRHGVSLELHGYDRSPTAVAYAQQAADRGRYPNVAFFERDISREPLPEGYDVVMCTLFLHHFDDAQAVALLQRMKAAAGRAVLVDDLLRTRLGYFLCWAGCQLLTRSRMVHQDGPQSVRAAVTIREARKLADAAGLAGATFRRHWPERFLMQWRKP